MTDGESIRYFNRLDESLVAVVSGYGLLKEIVVTSTRQSQLFIKHRHETYKQYR